MSFQTFLGSLIIVIIDQLQRSLVESVYSLIEPINCQCRPHIETNRLVYTANQFAGFYMRATLEINGLIDGYETLRL